MLPTPTTSNCVCRAFLPPAIFPATPCSKRDSPADAEAVVARTNQGRASASCAPLFGMTDEFLLCRQGLRLAQKSGRELRVMTLTAAQHPQRIMQRRDIEHAVQAGAGEHLVDETRRVYQFELDPMAARPVMQ